MGATAVVCPHCGYDFPDYRKTNGPSGFRRTDSSSRFPVAVALVGLFRILAVAVGLVFVFVIALSWETATRSGTAGWASLLLQALGGIGAAALLLAVAEGLNLGLAIEANTYRNEKKGEKEGSGKGDIQDN
jgi:hypothetical protein